jgi:hypothetical protein
MTGQALFTMALQVEEAGIISLVRSVDVVNGFLAQWLFLNETVHVLSIYGSVVVVVGLTLAAWNKLRVRRRLELDRIVNDLFTKQEPSMTGIENDAFQTVTLDEMERANKMADTANGVSVQMQLRKQPEESEKTL